MDLDMLLVLFLLVNSSLAGVTGNNGIEWRLFGTYTFPDIDRLLGSGGTTELSFGAGVCGGMLNLPYKLGR